MTTERVVSDWLRASAPSRAPETLLAAIVERATAMPQGSPGGLRGRLALGGRPSFRLLVTVAILGLALLGGVVLGAGLLRPPLPRPTPAGRLGALAYDVDGSIFLEGTDRDAPPAVAIAKGTAGGAQFGIPSWSPDGRYLKYYESGTDAGRTFIVDPQGHAVSSNPGWFGTWSPDSTRIAAWDLAAPSSVGIWSVDGRRLATLAMPADAAPPGDSRPTFTSDGKALYLDLGRVDGQPKAVPLDGSAPHPLAPIRTAGAPVFSHDGRRMALASTDGLYVAAADGSALRRVAHPGVGRYFDPRWSRLDDRIAVAWETSGDVGSPVAFSLVVIDVVTGQPRIVWPGAPGEDIHPIRWAPDGRSILAIVGPRLVSIAVNDQPEFNQQYAEFVFFEGPVEDRGSDWADWQWIIDEGS